MNLPPRCTLRLAAAFFLAAVPVSLLPFGGAPEAWGRAKAASPYRLAVEVVYGASPGPESLRESLERDLIRSLETAGCFAAVERYRAEAPDPADLLLRMIVDDLKERSDYDVSLSQRDAPDQSPYQRQPMIATLEARIDIQLWLLSHRALVRSRSFVESRGYRPNYQEDPTREVESILVAALTKAGRSFACKGGSKRLRKEVDRALSSASEIESQTP